MKGWTVMTSVGDNFLANDRHSRHPGELVRKLLGVSPRPGTAAAPMHRPSWAPSFSLDKGSPRLIVPGVSREPFQGCAGFLSTQVKTTAASFL